MTNLNKYFAILTLILAFALTTTANAQFQFKKAEVPAEVEKFIGKGTMPIKIESTDLNNDGLQDYVLLLTRDDAKFEAGNTNMKRGLVLILVRGNNNQLTETTRNENFVWSGFFTNLKAAKNTFTIFQEGGNFNRWNESLKFDYSRIDQTWELVRKENVTYQAVGSAKESREIKTPKDFGKIKIADFNSSMFDQEEDPTATEVTVNDLVPAGNHLVHKIVKVAFGGSNSGGQNEPAADSWEKSVLLYSYQEPADTYKILVAAQVEFEAFDTWDLPEPESTWSIMEPLAVFFENVDKDKEKELLILERCLTGVGPMGTLYFYRTRVYDWNGQDFVHLDRLSEKIDNLNTAAKVRKKLAGFKK